MTRYSGDQYVPAVDSANNAKASDVIGNKSDTHDGDSLYAKVETLGDHIHSVSKVYPTLAGGVQLTAGAAWTLGALVEIVPASTITGDFDIHAIDIEDISANDVYELVIYYGAGDTEAGRVRFVQSAAQSATLNTAIQTPILPANSRIRAAVACSTGGYTVDISIRYHTY